MANDRVNDNLKIRQATTYDIHALAEIGARTFYQTFRAFNTEEDMQAYIGKAYSPEHIANALESNAHYYLCFYDDQLIGYLKLIHNATYTGLEGQRSIELEKIYVLHDFFGSGAGKALMDQAIMHSLNNGFDVLFLGVWQENKRAVRFYEKNGFKIFETRKFKLGETVCDDFLMKLDLLR